MSLLLEAKSMPELNIKPRLILVTHTDEMVMEHNVQLAGKMFIHTLNRIVRKTNATDRAVTVLQNRQYSN